MSSAQLVFVPKDAPVSYKEIRRDAHFIPRYIHVHNSHELCFVPSHTAFQVFSGGNRWDVKGPALVFHRAGCYHELLSIKNGQDYESRVVHFFTESLPLPSVILPSEDCAILPLSESESSIFTLYYSLIAHEPLQRKQLAVLMILDRLRECADKTLGGSSVDSYIFSLLRHLAAYPEENPTIEKLAARYHVSPSKLKQDFTAITGMPVRRYITRQRLQFACKLLRQPNLSMTQIACRCGFCSQSHFIAAFRGQFGITPGQYRKEQHEDV